MPRQREVVHDNQSAMRENLRGRPIPPHSRMGEDDRPRWVRLRAGSRLLAGVGDFAAIWGDVASTGCGAIVSISPGELAIYWGEEPGAKFILRAKRKSSGT